MACWLRGAVFGVARGSVTARVWGNCMATATRRIRGRYVCRPQLLAVHIDVRDLQQALLDDGVDLFHQANKPLRHDIP